MLNLPALPEGYFWCVKSDGWGFMEVQIRYKRKLFGSRFVEHSYVTEDPPVDAAIESTARFALRKFNERGDNAAFLAEFRTFEGDYGKKG